MTGTDKLIVQLYDIDNKKVISILQKNGIFINKANPTKEDVLSEVNSITNNTTLVNILYSINFNIDKYKEHKSNNRDFSVVKLRKQIQDYIYVINELKNREVGYKKNLMLEDTNTRQFEKYTKEWADVQDKIKMLSQQLRDLSKKLPKNFL